MKLSARALIFWIKGINSISRIYNDMKEEYSENVPPFFDISENQRTLWFSGVGFFLK